MKPFYQTILSSQDLKPPKHTSNKGFSSNEINLEKYLLKYKASNINSLFHRLKDFTKDRDIQEVLDWYSNFDGATKREITSYKSKNLIDFIGQLYLKEMDIKKKVKTKDYCDKEQDIYNKKPSEEKSNFYNEMYNYDEGKKSDENDVKSTEETEKKEEQDLNKNNEDFLKCIKICSLEDVTDTLIFNIETNELKEYFNHFSKGDSKIKPINPEIINNELYIILSNWDNLQSFLQIIVCTLILLHYEYYLLTKKLNEMPFLKKLEILFQENESKIKEFIGKKVDVTNEIFIRHNLIFLAGKFTNNYFEKNLDKKYQSYKNAIFNFNIELLEDLKNNLSKFNTNEEKLKILFEKISFFNLTELKYAKRFIYFEFRNFLLKYDDPNQNFDVFYRNIIYNTEKLKPIKDKYLASTKELLLRNKLNKIVKIVEFGSYFTGLATEFSDIDILIVYNDSLEEKEYCKNLSKYLNDIKDKENITNLNIHTISYTGIPVIKITYDVTDKNELDEINEINYSLKYLDAKKDDLKKIKIDITFTNKTERVKKTKKSVRIIKESLKKYIQLKPVVLYLKIYFIIEDTYSIYEGGINSISLFCLPRNRLVMLEALLKLQKEDRNINSFSNLDILLETSNKFGHYDFSFGIDKDGYNNYSLNSSERVKKIFVIQNPADNGEKNVKNKDENNVASGFHNPSDIITKFSLLYNHINEGGDIFFPLQELLTLNK